MRAVRFDKYGGIDVLHLVDVDRPKPVRGQVLVRVKAAGINPGEAKIREGKLADVFPSTFPSGEGSDLAGIVAEVGPEVTDFVVGDEVIGFTDNRASHAEYVVVDDDKLVHRPPHVPWEEAGSLFVVGTTAYAAVRAVALEVGDTVVVSGAAGGVGSIAVQLARMEGATVIGVAGPDDHAWLAEHGVIPVEYGDGVEDRIKEAAEGKPIDAFIDTRGGGYVELAIELGVKPDRIDTITDFPAAAKYHVKTDGNSKGASADVLEELAGLIDAGELELRIAQVYPLSDVREAYRALEQDHPKGKIVLEP
jgi:NADPH:quinone reductase-like Zn-dependent oxidoreductase